MKGWWAVVAAVVLVVAFGGTAAIEYAPEREFWRAQVSGYLAVVALMLSLGVTPLRAAYERVVSTRSLGGAWFGAMRRGLGLIALVLAGAHAAFAMSTELVVQWRHLWFEPHLRAGASALVVLIGLGGTSWPQVFSGRLKRWKVLHRAVYLALGLVGLHVLLASHGTPLGQRLVIGVGVGLLVVRGVRGIWMDGVKELK